MAVKTKEKVETEITLTAGDKSVTMTGEEFDKATGEILGKNGKQLSLFDGRRVNLIENSMKGGELIILDGDGPLGRPLKLGDKVRLFVEAEVVKVSHGRNKDGLLVRLQTLATGVAGFDGFSGGSID